MQLHPRESFTIVRQLQDPYITGTFYVRAVIKNAKTDTVLETLDLTDNGSQYFTKSWLVPADVSGQGFYISIKTSVYTDSGYTTKSENYGDEVATYLVQERYVFNPNYPVGPDIDYKKIKKIIEEVVDEKMKKHKLEPKVVTVTKEVIKDITFPTPEKITFPEMPKLDPIIKALERIEKKELPAFPEIPKVDFEPILAAIQKAVDLSVKQKEEIVGQINEVFNKNTARHKKIQEMKKIFSSFNIDDEDEEEVVPSKKKEPKEDPRIKSLINKP